MHRRTLHTGPAALLAVALLATFGVGSARALTVEAPYLDPVQATDATVTYQVFALGTANEPRTRGEGFVVAKGIAGDFAGATESVRFIRDYPSKTTQLTLPHDPPLTITLIRGTTYSVKVAGWLVGGGGTAGEIATGPETTVVVPEPEVKERLSPGEKAEWGKASARSVNTAALVYTLLALPMPSGSEYSFREQAAREMLRAREARKLQLDPVDRQFRKLARARRLPAPQFDAVAAGSAARAISAVLNAQGRLVVELEAVNTSIFRAQGAFVKKMRRHEQRQMLNAATHAARAAAAARSLVKALPAEVAALRARYPGLVEQTVGQPQSDALAAQIVAGGGVPAADRAVLARLGAKPGEIGLVGARLASAPTIVPVTGAILIAGPEVLAQLEKEARLLIGFVRDTRRAAARR